MKKLFVLMWFGFMVGVVMVLVKCGVIKEEICCVECVVYVDDWGMGEVVVVMLLLFNVE